MLNSLITKITANENDINDVLMMITGGIETFAIMSLKKLLARENVVV